MASSIIPTSTWSHNCGMHVIADFLVERLQQDNYKTIFSGRAYDELLECFQVVYRQEDLSWEKIRESCIASSRINAQIIWGIALRVMLQHVIKNNAVYQQTFEEQYLALLNLLIEEKYQEAAESYPILLSANQHYLMQMAKQAEGFSVTAQSLEAQKLQQQFNECGFNRYCEAIMAINNIDGDELYHWLGISELTVICDYFEINPVINNHYQPSRLKKGPDLHFRNSAGLHWERIGENAFNKEMRVCDKQFYQEYINNGNTHFVKNLEKIGQIYFSGQYLNLHAPGSVSLFEEMKEEFLQACIQGECAVFSELLAKHQFIIHISDENKNNLLHHLALEYNNRNAQALIKELANAKIDLNAVNHKGYTALHCAAMKNNVFAIVELVRQGAVVDFVTPEGLSACHVSAIYDNKQAFLALKFLGASLSLEAYPNAINCLPFLCDLNISLTPLKIAEQNHEKIYDYLLKNDLVTPVLRTSSQQAGKIIIVDATSKKEHKFSLSLVIKTLYGFYLKNKNDRQLCLNVQNDFFLKSEIELSLLDDESLKIIDAFYEESFPEWIKQLVEFFENKNDDKKTCLNTQKIIDSFSKHACKAILENKENKIIDCLIADYRCLFLSGKNSALHCALKINKYDHVKKVIYDFLKESYKLKISPTELKERLDQTFDNASETILDEHDRTLSFRLSRKRQNEELKQKIAQSETIAEQLKYRTQLSQHYAGDLSVFCVDKLHEKNKHTAKIQEKKISKWGYPFMLALRSTGQIASGGMIRFGFEMARPLLPNMVQLPFTYVGGKVGIYVGEKMGYEAKYAEQYTKLAISHVISFALMPQYYVVSTVLGGVVYYTFKDSGYDNIEALCQLVADNVSLSATNNFSNEKNIKTGEAYQYQLNKNLVPVVGEHAANYISPVVTLVDNSSREVDKFLSGHLNQFLSQSTISSIANTTKETFATPVGALQHMQQYANSWVESGFNLIESNTLHYLMNDSKFKAERLHAIQLYNTHQLQQTHSQLKTQAEKENDILKKAESDLEQAELFLTELSNNLDTPASDIHRQKLIISNLQEIFDRQQSYVKKIEENIATQAEAISNAIDLTEELYEKTEGSIYQEKWKDAYFSYKYSLFKPNKSKEESEKLFKASEQALLDCQFYNTDVVNRMLDPWAKSIDNLFERHKDNFPDWGNPAHVIGSIVNSGFKTYTDRNQLAKFLADEIIRLKYPLYPDVGDKKEIEAERELLLHEISTDELSGYKRKPHRSKNRLYDYFIAKVQNVDKKRHQHRWEKATKPIANEFLQKTVGLRPFKEFNGGEDGEPGRVGVQFNFHSDGSKDAQFTIKDRPIALLYQTEKPVLKLTAPDRQMSMATLPSSQSDASGQYEGQSAAALTYPNAEKDEAEPYSSFYKDNAYIQDYMAEQHADLCSNIDKLGKEDKENHKDKKTYEKPIKQKASETTDESIETPKPVVFSRLAQNTINKGGWSRAHDNFLGNPQSASALLGPRAPIQVSPDFLNSLIPVAKDKVSVSDLPGLMWNGLTESGKDLFNGMISLAEFTGQETLHLVKGEDLVTVQAAALLKEFIGEEAARYAMGQKLKSAVMAKVLVRRFQKLSHEERIQGGVELFLSITVEPLAAFKGLVAARKAGKQITQVAKEAAKSGIPEPVRFAPVSKTPALAHLPKGSENIRQLATKLHEAPKVRVLNSASEALANKVFTPQAQNHLVQSTAWQSFKSLQPRVTGARDLNVYELTKADQLAELIYEKIRLNTSDIKSIAQNTGLSEIKIERIKNHLFFKEHQLNFVKGRFDADPLIVESWSRLESGKFTNHDIQLLNHELFESKFEGIFKTDYITSHNAANRAGYVSPVEALNPEQISEIYRGFLYRFG